MIRFNSIQWDYDLIQYGKDVTFVHFLSIWNNMYKVPKSENVQIKFRETWNH